MVYRNTLVREQCRLEYRLLLARVHKYLFKIQSLIMLIRTEFAESPSCFNFMLFMYEINSSPSITELSFSFFIIKLRLPNSRSMLPKALCEFN